jgi:hypothetical protein
LLYILVGDIILLPSSPVHIQYNIWKFHVHNTKFGAWYLLQLLQATYCSYITSFTILHSIVLHTYPQYLLYVAVQIFQLALVFWCRWCGQCTYYWEMVGWLSMMISIESLCVWCIFFKFNYSLYLQ